MTQQTETICPYCNNEHASYYLYPDQETTFCSLCGYLEEHDIDTLGNREYSHITSTPHCAYEYITPEGTRYFGSMPTKVRAVSYKQDCLEDPRCVSLIYYRFDPKTNSHSSEVMFDKEKTLAPQD
jgi:hypothetical protein